MKRVRPLKWFLASLPFWMFRSNAAMAPPLPAPAPEPLEPVKLRALNLPGDNLFAGHRSHSSHSSHSSHRSGSGGYSAPAPAPYVAPAPAPYVAPAPRPAPAPSALPGTSSLATPTSPSSATPQRLLPAEPGQSADGARSAVHPQSATGATATAPMLTLEQKRRLQIMRVQIALTTLGVYSGRINGELTDECKDGIKRFQIVKGLPETGLMTTETLNALGVPAVQ